MTLRNKKQTISNEEEFPKTVNPNLKPIQKTSKSTDLNLKIGHSNVISKIVFRENEVVWCKIKGFVHWPARIERIEIVGGKQCFIVFWFNDYRTSKVFGGQLFKFLPNFQKYSANFKGKIGLETAAKEAVIYSANLL